MRARLGPGRPPQKVKAQQRGEHRGRRADQQQAPHTAFMISDALVPPKPKLLLSTALTLRSLALCGTRSTPAQPSDGLSRLSVGGTIWSRMARMQKMLSTAPAPPSRWPIADLVLLIDAPHRSSPNTRLAAASSIVSAIVEVPLALMLSM